MKTDILDYYLPKERIASYPAQNRDSSKLMYINKLTQEVQHLKFADLLDILQDDYAIYRNNVSVLKARIFANKSSGANVECLLLKPVEANKWECMLKPAKRLNIDSTFGVDKIFKAKVLEKYESGTALIDFYENKYQDVITLSENIGLAPLPPYIGRNQKEATYDKTFDNQRYQTVYADQTQITAAAAPTAGLHFTQELNNKLLKKNHKFYELTLHIGMGTFQPLKADYIQEHKMHSEIYQIPQDTLSSFKDSNLKRLAVGTTTLRAMEDFFRKNNTLDSINDTQTYSDEASLFIYPPQEILSANAMITNFHLPRSSLMCLVATFLKPNSIDGIDWLKELYNEAIDKKYNFYSYGDAMLIV